MYPRIDINTEKLKQNSKIMVDMCSPMGIDLMGVTKCFCAYKEAAQAMVDGGIKYLADSRVGNLKRVKELAAKKVLLRIPMHSEVDEVVEYADYSLNSELSTLKLLGEAASKKGRKHYVVLMVDLGDLREGVWADNIEAFVDEAVLIDGIEIRGFGVNLTCYGGVMPDEKNLGRLIEISKTMAERHNLTLDIISGGNSSSVYLLEEKRLPEGINNLRLGEVLLLGRETAFGNDFAGLNKDVFILKAQIVELKDKPSMPIGTIGMDAFGNKPSFEDKGIIKRAIVAVGKQDIDASGLTPLDEKIEILGGSSDHTILNLTNTVKEYKVGDIVEFYLDYGSLLRGMTSEYVNKNVI